jgi:hypothetical protein
MAFEKTETDELMLAFKFGSSETGREYVFSMPINRAVTFAMGLIAYLYHAALWRFDGFRESESETHVAP